eukprot:719767_1
MTLWGLCFAGPSYGAFYPRLGRFVERAFPTSRLRRIALQMCTDQFVFAPSLMVVFFGVTEAMERHSKQQFIEKMRHAYIPTLMLNMMFWPTIMLGNFIFVPVVYQALVVNCGALVWTSVLSYMRHRPHAPKLRTT